MEDRLKVDGLYKIFGSDPSRAMELLASGGGKDRVFSELNMVVGLNDVSLSVPSGAIYMVMGLSGSGKSTLARCVNRLHEPNAGHILLDGQDLTKLGESELREVRRTRISMVFQHFALLPNKSVLENVEFGLKLRGMPSAARRKRAEEVLSVVGLSRWGHHRPSELSGGMRQRVGLARALATDADVLIMDEAFSALDPLIRSEMQDELLRLQHTLKKTILFITHDFQEALKLGNRIAIMADGEVVREGTPSEIVLDPRSEYVAAFTRDVDRSRLFDAASAMIPMQDAVEVGGAMIVPGPDGAMAVAVDADMRILGVLHSADVDNVRSGGAVQSFISEDFVTVGKDAKLIDVARAHRSGRPLLVTDSAGRMLGQLTPDRVLAQIASVTSSANTAIAGDLHA